MEKNINPDLDLNDIDTTLGFDQLPEEIKLYILQKTSPTMSELAKFSLVCKQWKIIREEKSLWDPKNHFISKQHFIDTVNSAKERIGENWRPILSWILKQGPQSMVLVRKIDSPSSNQINIVCLGKGNKQHLVDKYKSTPHYPSYDNYLEIEKDVNLYRIFHAEELPEEVNIVFIFPEEDLTNIQALINQAKLIKHDKLIFIMSTNENHKKLINSNLDCQGVFNTEIEGADDFRSLISNIYSYIFDLRMLTTSYFNYSEKNKDESNNEDEDNSWVRNIRLNIN